MNLWELKQGATIVVGIGEKIEWVLTDPKGVIYKNLSEKDSIQHFKEHAAIGDCLMNGVLKKVKGAVYKLHTVNCGGIYCYSIKKDLELGTESSMNEFPTESANLVVNKFYQTEGDAISDFQSVNKFDGILLGTDGKILITH